MSKIVQNKKRFTAVAVAPGSVHSARFSPSKRGGGEEVKGIRNLESVVNKIASDRAGG